jgi:hypothetical protein
MSSLLLLFDVYKELVEVLPFESVCLCFRAYGGRGQLGLADDE